MRCWKTGCSHIVVYFDGAREAVRAAFDLIREKLEHADPAAVSVSKAPAAAAFASPPLPVKEHDRTIVSAAASLAYRFLACGKRARVAAAVVRAEL